MGERSAGNPHAAFDAEGAGNVAASKCFDPSRRASPRPYLGAPGVETPLGDSTLPAGLIRAARAIVGGAKAVTRPKPVEQSTRICLSIYRGTAATLGFAKPAL